MFRLYSKGCEYAIRALICAVSSAREGRFRARDVCERSGIPEAYTRKVLQSLVQGGFLKTVPGPGGGYELTRSPSALTLLEIIRAVDGEDTFDSCVLGLPNCDQGNPCPLHRMWAEEKARLLAQLDSITLKDLLTL